MAGGECHMSYMTIGLCEVNLGGCHEGESSEPMSALTLGQGVEQNFQRLIRNSTNDTMYSRGVARLAQVDCSILASLPDARKGTFLIPDAA